MPIAYSRDTGVSSDAENGTGRCSSAMSSSSMASLLDSPGEPRVGSDTQVCGVAKLGLPSGVAGTWEYLYSGPSTIW